MRRWLIAALQSPLRLALVALALGLSVACDPPESERENDPRFPVNQHDLLPLYYPADDTQVATGTSDGVDGSLTQPIPFSHYLHATELTISCQYCHSEARRSIHSGVPPLQTCMGCHAYVKKESPEVQKIHQHWCGQPDCGAIAEDAFGKPVPPPEATPIPWSKVHDVPDYVHFNHSRHIQAGVICQECHGQVQLQGQYTLLPIPGAPVVEGQAPPTYRQVEDVMVRETSLQMGWCLECHRSHPSIDQNYGDQAVLRRAELRDCWTCHK
jgi:hypothetical protein